ncbi:uncharacterized protein LOC127854149 [Dreissena polymorpha]|uniref:uncharacterized protein LOC127854149 n=1 Tax=Dreissena polymorpha TaxID=45954 RepID=UPI0022643047|nr:uncharacterized protein LOC127854149 [Dreissena polymorpha]
MLFLPPEISSCILFSILIIRRLCEFILLRTHTMKETVVILACCTQLTFSSPIAIRCGLTWCENVGYESCIRPPEVRTEQDADCYSCQKLDLVGDPCDPANTRQGCVLYCTDKAKEKEKQIWNDVQWSLNLTWQRLFEEKDNNVTMLHTDAEENARRLDEANRKIKLLVLLFPALLTLCLIGLFIVLCVCWKYRKYHQVEIINVVQPDENSTNTGSYSESHSESVQPVNESIARPSESVELIEASAEVTRGGIGVGERESHNSSAIQFDADLRDGRLSNVSPQQNDSPLMYTGSRSMLRTNELTLCASS